MKTWFHALSLIAVALLTNSAGAMPNPKEECDQTLNDAVAVEVSTDPNHIVPLPPEEIANSKVLFETSFTVHGSTQDEAWTRLITHGLRWANSLSALKGREKAALRGALQDHADAPFVQILLREQTFRFALSNLRGNDGRRKSWALIVEHVDPRDRHLYWRVDLALTSDGTDGVHFTSMTSVSHPNARGLHISTLSSRPKLVEGILNDHALNSFSGSMPMSVTAFALTPGSMPAFMTAVRDPERVLPLLLVSRDLRDDQPRFDVDALALHLRGFASVVVEPPVELNGLLSVNSLGTLKAHDGDIRIIGPAGAILGSIRRRYGISDADVLLDVGRQVVRTNMSRIRTERRGWVSSIFDVLP